MSNECRQFRADEKIKILKQHLVEKKPVSEVCEQHGLVPNLFYRWQQEFFQNRAAGASAGTFGAQGFGIGSQTNAQKRGFS